MFIFSRKHGIFKCINNVLIPFILYYWINTIYDIGRHVFRGWQVYLVARGGKFFSPFRGRQIYIDKLLCINFIEKIIY